MKLLIIFLLPFSALAISQNTQPFESALKAIFEIGGRLQHLLEGNDSPDNFLVSPLSITALIGQLMIGAQGKFRDDLFELLSLEQTHAPKESNLNVYTEEKNDSSTLPYSKFHLEMYSLLRHLEKSDTGKRLFTLDQKNAVFYDQRLKLTGKFKHYSKLFYDSELAPTNFLEDPKEAQKKLNNWAETQTHGLIKNIFPAPPAPYTSAIFLSSIYFLAEWEVPFSDILNRELSFTVNENKNVNVTYMFGTMEQILFSQTEKFTMIALPYKNNELEMFIILPHKDNPYKYDIKKFAQTLNASEVLTAIEKAKYRDVNVKIPKLSLSSSISVLEPLLKFKQKKDSESGTIEARNVKENIVTREASSEILLTNAVENSNLRINDIVQEMVFSINEKGTEAAAVAIGSIEYSGGQKRFIVDRPFTFFIRHQATTATLFWGTISDPSTR